MPLKDLPLLYGGARIKPVGRISIFNDEFERLLVDNVKAHLFNRTDDIIKLEFGIESRVTPDNDITIISFSLIPALAIKKEQ